MKQIKTLIIYLLFTCVATGNAFAGERADHYKGKVPKSLDQAMSYLRSHNAQLNTLLKTEKLSPQQLDEIHQMTYTMENAIKKLKNEVTVISDSLEALHKASETGKTKITKNLGEKYLLLSKPLVEMEN